MDKDYEITAETVSQTALRYLNGQIRTESELRRKLMSKAYDDVLIEAAILMCKNYGYIDDYKYALIFIVDKMNVSGFGRIRIEYELRKKGIADKIITKAYSSIENNPQKYLTDCGLDDAEFSAANKSLKKKFKNQDLSDIAAKKRAYSFLARRGFGHETIIKCVKDIDGNDT